MILTRTLWMLLGFMLFILCLCAAIIFQNSSFLLLPFAVLITIISFKFIRFIWLACIGCLPISIEYSINQQWGTDLPAEPLLILCTGIFLLLAIIKSVKIEARFFSHPLFVLVLVSFIWVIISCVFSTHFLLSVKFLVAKIWYIIPFVIFPFIFLQTVHDFKKVSIVYTTMVLLTIVYVLFRHFSKGFLFDEVNQSVQPFYRNHVNYAAVVVCSIPILYTMYTLSHQALKKILLLFLWIAMMGLFLSYSRGAWLALFIGMIAFFILQKGLLSKGFLLSMGIIIISVLWLAKDNRYIQYHPNYKKTIYHANFKDHWKATFAGTDMSNAERFNRWIAGIRMVKEQPFTGYGPATFYKNYKPYMVTYFKTWVSDNKEQSTVHNYFLLVLIEQGWIGFLLLILLVYILLRSLEKAYQKTNDVFNKKLIQCIAVIFSMVLTLNMLSDLVETDKVGSLFYLCIGTTIIVSLPSSKLKKEV